MRPLILSSFIVGCGAFAGWLVASLLPPAPRSDELDIWLDDYHLERRGTDAFEVADGKWLRVPRLLPDFDLQMDVELAPSMDLDLVVRQVEPRLVQGVKVPFQERFGVLRITTGQEGPAWRTREEALFGEHGSGASVAPGLLATVWVEARGRRLRANVAGKWLPWFEAEDVYGGLTLVARGGKAVLRRLAIENLGWPNAWLWSRWFWLLVGAAGGAVLAVVATVRRTPLLQAAVAGCAVVAYLGYWLAWRAELQPLRFPPPEAMFLLLGGNFLLAAIVVWASAWRRTLAAVAVVVAAVVAQQFAMDVARRGLQSDTRAVDEVFGPLAGNTLGEALAQIVRGPFGLHTPGAPEPRVFLLGGSLLYERYGPPEEHLEPLVRGELRAALRKPVEVVSLPTTDGHTAQQWSMFTRFFAAGHRPNVLVFGVPRGEADRGTGLPPRSWPSTVEGALREARAWAREAGCELLVFTEHGLPADLLAELRKVEAAGVPLVVASDGEASPALAKRLAAAILVLLGK